MSRVFSSFASGASLSVRARISDSSAVADRVFETREMPEPRLALGKFARPARKLSIRPSPGRVALNHSGTKCDCKNCENNENSTNMGSGASAGECAAALAGECVFGSVFADMACGMNPAPPLLWPCLLLPMPKGMAAGHQQALAAQAAAQAEKRRIRGR